MINIRQRRPLVAPCSGAIEGFVSETARLAPHPYGGDTP